MKFAFAPESKPLEGYTIKRAIHRGGFGEVYYALSDAGKEVALKLLHNNLEVELRGVTQCLNLKHPNLVTIFDIRQDSEQDHWIVMEFVGGKGLYEVLHEHPDGMLLRDVLFWLSGITSGLSFLHDRGIVHRDLKPANIFCDADIVKIGDVGLSKYISESRRSAQTQSVGTVYYMAPEVARGRYGREVDVYSTGIILYEMITGRVPFEGETTAEILMKHLTAEPDLSPLPERLRPVIRAALEKDPDRRISDIEELERQFRLAIEESGFSVEKPAPMNAPSRFSGTEAPRTNRYAAAMATTHIGGNGRTQAAGVSRVADALHALGSFWQNHVPTPARWIIGTVIIVIILNRGIVRLGFVEWMVIGIVYVAYYRMNGSRDRKKTGNVVMSATPVSRTESQATGAPLSVQTAATSPAGSPVRSAVQPPSDRLRNASAPQTLNSARVSVEYSPATRRQIPAGQRAVDLTTSLSLALAATILVTAAVYLATPLLPRYEEVAFFGIVTLTGAVSLMIPGKLWEGKTGDNVLRRLIQGGIGLCVGAVAAALQQFLMVSRPQLLRTEGSGFFVGVDVGVLRVITNDGFPTMSGYVLFFGLLFLTRRWWWQADSFRRSRFRISSALFSLFLGFLLAAVLPFSSNLGATWALSISAVLQLSSGWTPPEERRLVLQRPA